MQIDFRIEWGYHYLYSRRHYHPVYLWDGELTCNGGKINKIYMLNYPVIMYGPGQCAKETLLSEPKWKNMTKRGISGMRVEADVCEDTVFCLKTASANITFNAKDIIENGRVEFLIGPKYLGCAVSITKTDYLWFRPNKKDNEHIIEVDEMNLPIHNWARMRLAWLENGQSVKFVEKVEKNSNDINTLLIHLIAMAVPKYNGDKEFPVEGVIPFDLICDGKVVKTFKRYYRFHDEFMQLLEDEWQEFEITPGQHTIEIVNKHENLCVGISRITTKNCGYNHGQLSIPSWCLVNERIIGNVYSVTKGKMNICVGDEHLRVRTEKGWNEFPIKLSEANINTIKSDYDSKTIEVYNCEEEEHPVKVGYDMTVVPHDDNGYMDWILDYTHRTRLGNYVVFRNFSKFPTPENTKARWGEFCKNHSIYISAVNEFMDGSYINGAQNYFNDCGMHELSGAVYALDANEETESYDMKEASIKFINYLKSRIDEIHTVSKCAAFGDASGGIRYSFIAGADFVRAETMVGNTMPLLAQTRAAAEALGKGRWGVHIAIQHAYQLYRENHLGQYFLSLLQAWCMGAEVIYEEDSLFELFKEERQTWDDALTKGKRDMTRNFFKFAKTHPRTGKCIRNIGFIDGRYAAPFNGFICGSEQDPHYSVWGLFGNKSEEWGHGQPEKCHQILDVLMPGANTHPLRQRFDKRRFWFAGTSCGDFDIVPIEANAQYLDNYKLLLNLGWNTMIDEDYIKLKSFVENGGVLLTGITQFSTHTRREFLKDMEDLSLFNNGDLSEMCGFKILGRGEEYCGQWNCSNKEEIEIPSLSAMPSDDLYEDKKAYMAEIQLCGAQIVAWDAFSGKPLLVRKALGKGYVYTFTIWAYPGHELFQDFTASWLLHLSKENRSDIYVESESNEIFWTKWKDNNCKKIMLLNTDWTSKGNVKEADLVLRDKRYKLEIKERILTIATICDEKITVDTYSIN